MTDIGYHFEFGKYVTWYILSKKSKLQNEDVPFLLNIDTMLFISEIYRQLLSLRFKLPVSFTVAVSNMKTKNSVLNVIYYTKTGEVKVKSCDAQFTRLFQV